MNIGFPVAASPRQSIVHFNRVKGRWEFRVLGWGVRYKHTRIHPPHFKECLGLVHNFAIGPYWFKLIRP